MQLNSAPSSALVPDNLASAQAALQTDNGAAYRDALMLCLADAMDDIISGKATHLTIGMNQKRTSLLLTANGQAGQKGYVPATNLEDLIWQWSTTIGPKAAAALLDQAGG